MNPMVRVGLVQLRTPATHAEALAHAEPLVRRAASQGATLIVTPEATNIFQGDRGKLSSQLTTLAEDPVVRGLASLASELNVQLLIGSALVRRADGQAANRSVLVGPEGEIQATYDKIHMFDVDLPNGERYRESATYTPGETAVVAQSPAGRMGLTICYDLRFPALHRALARAGAAVITVPSAFTRPTGEAHWEVLLRARAIETGAYVLAAAQGGVHDDGRGTWGRSMVVDPWGLVTARLDDDEPGVLIADLDLDKVDAARAAIPALNNERDYAAPSTSEPSRPVGAASQG